MGPRHASSTSPASGRRAAWPRRLCRWPRTSRRPAWCCSADRAGDTGGGLDPARGRARAAPRLRGRDRSARSTGWTAPPPRCARATGRRPPPWRSARRAIGSEARRDEYRARDRRRGRAHLRDPFGDSERRWPCPCGSGMLQPCEETLEHAEDALTQEVSLVRIIVIGGAGTIGTAVAAVLSIDMPPSSPGAGRVPCASTSSRPTQCATCTARWGPSMHSSVPWARPISGRWTPCPRKTWCWGSRASSSVRSASSCSGGR